MKNRCRKVSHVKLRPRPMYKSLLISKMIATASGRKTLASTMASPIRTRIDYQAVGRSALVVQPLPEGALPSYEKKKVKKD